MIILISIFTIYCIIYSPEVVSLIVTKYDTNTFLKYYRHVSQYNADESEPSFEQQDLFQYCHALRQASKYRIVTTEALLNIQQSERVQCHQVPKEALETEKNQVQMQWTMLQLENSTVTFPVQSFTCLNFKAEFSWFIIPGFIPESALFFSIESFFSYATLKEIGLKKAISAKLEGIIDEPARILNTFATSLLHKSALASGFYSRDPLCGLNHILKFRLCSIVAELENGPRNMFENILNNQVYFEYPVKRYYQISNPEEFCVQTYYFFTRRGLFERSELQCRTNSLRHGNVTFTLTLNKFNSSQVFYTAAETRYADSIHQIHYLLEVPLLNHLEKYNRILDNVDL